MPAGTPEGLLSSLSPIRSVCLKTNPLFPKAGCGLSFLFFLLEIFLGFGRLRFPGTAVALGAVIHGAWQRLCPCVCWRMLQLHEDLETVAASLRT